MGPVKMTSTHFSNFDLSQPEATTLCAENELLVRDLETLEANTRAGGSNVRQ